MDCIVFSMPWTIADMSPFGKVQTVYQKWIQHQQAPWRLVESPAQVKQFFAKPEAPGMDMLIQTPGTPTGDNLMNRYIIFYLYIYIYVFVFVYMWLYVYLCLCLFLYIYIYINIFIYIYIHIYIYIYINIYI